MMTMTMQKLTGHVHIREHRWRRTSRRMSSLSASSSSRSNGTEGADVGVATLLIKKNSRLGIGRYPDFTYDASGGKAVGRWEKTDESAYRVRFDAIDIPALTSRTTTLFGALPIPPPLKIEIRPEEELQGTVNAVTGAVDLVFDASFCFTVGPLYAAPPLRVSTTLTTAASSGELRRAEGDSMTMISTNNRTHDDTEMRGSCRLVGVSTVPKVDIRPETSIPDVLFSSFLQLPTEALADLTAEIVLTRDA